jgi:hypothetical protein
MLDKKIIQTNSSSFSKKNFPEYPKSFSQDTCWLACLGVCHFPSAAAEILCRWRQSKQTYGK